MKFGAASSAAAMPGARSERTEDMSPAERGELPLFPRGLFVFHICFLLLLLDFLHIPMIYIDDVAAIRYYHYHTPPAEFSYRSFDVDPGTGLSLPVARPVGYDDDYSSIEEDCCCCNIL